LKTNGFVFEGFFAGRKDGDLVLFLHGFLCIAPDKLK